MDEIDELLKYILPALITGGATILTIRYFFQNERQNRQAAWRDQNRSTVSPIRLQAYERIVLFLERITPANLVIRVAQPEMESRQLHRLLVQHVREEYEHNLSLQIYISMKAWELVRTAKEDLVRVINQSAAETDPASPGMELAQKIIENYLKAEKPPLANATDYLKREVAQFF